VPSVSLRRLIYLKLGVNQPQGSARPRQLAPTKALVHKGLLQPATQIARMRKIPGVVPQPLSREEGARARSLCVRSQVWCRTLLEVFAHACSATWELPLALAHSHWYSRSEVADLVIVIVRGRRARSPRKMDRHAHQHHPCLSTDEALHQRQLHFQRARALLGPFPLRVISESIISNTQSP
jgi:hypothetical protein